MTSWRFRAGTAAAVVTLALGAALSGCSVQPGAEQRSTADQAPAAEDSYTGSNAGGQELQSSVAELPSSSIIRGASVSLIVTSVADAAAEVSAVANNHDGSVASQNLWNDGARSSSGDLTLRVPADTLDAVVTALADIGMVNHTSLSADDVTAQHVDLQARVSALEGSITRLTSLMDSSATTSELIEAESALAQRQQELDGLRAQLDWLEDQVAEATVYVSLTERSALPGGPSSFGAAFTDGLSSIGAFFAAAFIALGFALPWLALIALLALAVWLLVRARRRRAAVSRALPDAPSGSGTVPDTTETGATSESVAK